MTVRGRVFSLRFFVCFFLLVVFLVFPVCAAAEDGGDPPDPDYGGTADQDPANQGSGGDGGVSLQDMSAGDRQVLNSINTSLSTGPGHLQNIYNRVNEIKGYVDGVEGKLDTSNTHLTNIQNALSSGGSIYNQLDGVNTKLTNIYSRQNTIDGHVVNVYDRLGNLRTDVQNVNSSVQSQTSDMNANHEELMDQLKDIQYALDRDGFSNVTITSASRGSVSVPVSFDSSSSFYSFVMPAPGQIESGPNFRFYISDAPFLSTSNGLTFYLLFLLPVGSDYRVVSSDLYSAIDFPVSGSSSLSSSSVVSFSSPSSSIDSSLFLVKIEYPPLMDGMPFLPSDFVFHFKGFTISSGTNVFVRLYVSESGSHISDVTAAINSSFEKTDSNMNQSVNQGQAAATDQLQSEIDKSEAFESQIFEDVNRYTKQLDFGLSDWGEAANGISYISSVFMIIWDNSPKQPIILSLMFGLCALLLGRGARLAGEIRRSSERSERRTKGS